MAKVLARVATTGIVEQGGMRIRITREAIESVPEQVAGDKAIPFTVEHNPFCLPIGKIDEAWVEPYGEEFAVMARIYIEDTYTIATHRRSDAGLVRLDFKDSPKPFRTRSYQAIEQSQDTLAVDLANFDGLQDYTEFTKDISTIDDTISCNNGIQRYSLVPEPLLQFVISNPEITAALAVGGWIIHRIEKFVRYTVDETLRKMADDISDSLSMKMQRIVRAYECRRSDDNRDIVTQIVIPSDPELILLVKTKPGEDFPTIDLSKLTAEMEKYGDLLQDADSVTFARVGVNEWEFQYLATVSGKVIGTLECHKRTTEAMQSMKPDQDSELRDVTPPEDI